MSRPGGRVGGRVGVPRELSKIVRASGLAEDGTSLEYSTSSSSASSCSSSSTAAAAVAAAVASRSFPPVGGGGVRGSPSVYPPFFGNYLYVVKVGLAVGSSDENSFRQSWSPVSRSFPSRPTSGSGAIPLYSVPEVNDLPDLLSVCLRSVSGANRYYVTYVTCFNFDHLNLDLGYAPDAVVDSMRCVSRPSDCGGSPRPVRWLCGDGGVSVRAFCAVQSRSSPAVLSLLKLQSRRNPSPSLAAPRWVGPGGVLGSGSASTPVCATSSGAFRGGRSFISCMMDHDYAICCESRERGNFEGNWYVRDLLEWSGDRCRYTYLCPSLDGRVDPFCGDFM